MRGEYQLRSRPDTKSTRAPSIAAKTAASFASKGCGSSRQHDQRGRARGDFVERDAGITRVAARDRRRWQRLARSQIRSERIATRPIGEHVHAAREIERIRQERLAVDGHQRIHPDRTEHTHGRTRRASCARLLELRVHRGDRPARDVDAQQSSRSRARGARRPRPSWGSSRGWGSTRPRAARTICGVFSSWFTSTRSGAHAITSATRASLVPPRVGTPSMTPRGSTQ